jgi:hypothetical protein
MKKAAKNNLLSLVFTSMIVVSLLLLGPANALTLQLSSSKTNFSLNEPVNFIVEYERVNNQGVDLFNLSINNETCSFNIGNLNDVNLCQTQINNISINVSQTTSSFGYGYGYGYAYGYGFGFGGFTLNVTYNTNVTGALNVTFMAISQNNVLEQTNLTLNVIQTVQELDQPEETVSDDVETVIITNPNVEVIKIPSTNNNDVLVNLTSAGFNSTTNSLVVNSNFTLTRESSSANYSVVIPAGTTMNGSGWDGTLFAPKVELASNYSASSANVLAVITIGRTTALSFDRPVKITLPNVPSNARGAFSNSGNTLTTITNVCSNSTNPTVAADSQCYIHEGGNLIIFTRHFTSFAAVEETSSSSSSGSSSGSSTTTSSSGSQGPIEVTVYDGPTLQDSDNETQAVESENNEGIVDSESTTETVNTDISRGTSYTTASRLLTDNNMFISTLVILLVLMSFVYYNTNTVAGLSTRAQKLHRKALHHELRGEYMKGSSLRNKARNLQKKADEKKY